MEEKLMEDIAGYIVTSLLLSLNQSGGTAEEKEYVFKGAVLFFENALKEPYLSTMQSQIKEIVNEASSRIQSADILDRIMQDLGWNN